MFTKIKSYAILKMYNKEKIIRAIIGIIFLLLLYLENLSKKIIDIRAINALTNIEIIVLFY